MIMKSSIRVFTIVLAFVALTPAAHSETFSALDPGKCWPQGSMIDNVFWLSEGDATIKVYEAGGGDPALNGNMVFISVGVGGAQGDFKMWYPNIDVSGDIKVSKGKKNEIIINAIEETNENESVKRTPVTYSVKYSITDIEVSDKIVVSKRSRNR